MSIHPSKLTVLSCIGNEDHFKMMMLLKMTLLLLPSLVEPLALHRPDDEYAFDLLAKDPAIVEEGGVLRWATSGNWPVLSGGKTPDRGMAVALATVEGCTVGIPHHHIRYVFCFHILFSAIGIYVDFFHRADHLAYVTKGFNGTFGIVKEDGTLIENNKMDAGHLLYVPQGNVHYFVNDGCT